MKDTLTKQVKETLKDFPITRNSDIALTMQVWRTFYPKYIFTNPIYKIETIKVQDLFELPREDHIKRLRAVIQNSEHKYLPTDINILIERAKLSKEWKKFLNYSVKVKWTDEDWKTLLSEYDFENEIIIHKSRKKAKYPCKTCGQETKRGVIADVAQDKPNTMNAVIYRECEAGHKEYEK